MKTMSLDEAYAMIAQTEGIKTVTLNMDGTGGIPAFLLPSGWNVGLKDMDEQQVTTAVLGYNGVEYALTKEAVLSITHSIGLPPGYVARTPGVLIQTHLNYWATHSPDSSLKLLVRDNVVLTSTKQGITPFSNAEILGRVVDQLHTVTSEADELAVDSKSYHGLHSTMLRVVMPYGVQIISERQGQKVTDNWAYGVQVHNSLTGKHPLSVSTYFSSPAAESAVVMASETGRYNRKTMGQDPDDWQEWVTSATGAVVESWDHEVGVLTDTVGVSVDDSLSLVLADIFKTYRVPLKVRQQVLDNLVEDMDPTYYGIIHALIRTANLPDLPPHFVTAIMEIGGAVAHDVSHRCDSCKRVF